MKIVGYLKTSLLEWPGKIASVIFVPGCNFRCPFCHNASLVENTARLPLIDEELIFADLKKRKKWIDAVVITGGEPTLRPDLPEFIKKVKKMGFLVMIQTNGTKPKVIDNLLSCCLVDYVAMDLKGDLENYGKFTNSKLVISDIKKSLKIIAGSGVECELRTTVVPGLHNLDNLIKLAEQIKKEAGNCRWYLQQFRPVNTLDPEFMKVEPYTEKQMKAFQKKLQKIIPNIFLRGI